MEDTYCLLSVFRKYSISLGSVSWHEPPYTLLGYYGTR